MLRIILVGLGRISNVWIQAVGASPQVEFCALVDIDAATARGRIQEHGLDASLLYPSLDAALADAQADAIIDATPPSIHRRVALKALEAGLPVLSEKPLADSMEAAREIVATAQETGLLHLVAQNYRYKIPVQTARKVLESGRLGRIGSVTVEFFKGPILDGFHTQLRYPLLQDMAIHHFDMLRFFLDMEPMMVYARSWNPTWNWHRGEVSASAIFEFPGDLVASYNASWCATGVETPWTGNWRFECENGVLLLREDRVYLHLRTDELDNTGSFLHYRNESLRRLRPVRRKFEGQGYLLDEFYRALTAGHTPVTRCQDNIHSLAMVYEAIRSIETGAPVSFSRRGQAAR